MKRTLRISLLALIFAGVFGLPPLRASESAVQTSQKPSATKPPAASRQNESSPQVMVTRTFKLKYIRPEQLQEILGQLYRKEVRVIVDKNSVIVRTWPVLMDSVVELVKERDTVQQVSPDVRVLVYLLYASPKAGSDRGIPEVLGPAVEQLKKTFAFKSYQLLDTIMLRTTADDPRPATTSGTFLLPAQSENSPRSSSYKLALQRVTVHSSDVGTVIDFGSLALECSLSFRGARPLGRLDLSTKISVKKDQLVVLGKTSDGTPNAVIAVVTARTVQ